MKTAKAFLKHIIKLVNNQDMSDCSDWDKLTLDQQRMFYGLLAGVQNDIGELESSGGYLSDLTPITP